MATLAESLISSASRPLAVRKRPDLTASRHHYQGTGYWVVKEPVGLQYYRFHDEEYFILGLLDGHVSLQQIKDGFEQRFAPQKITFGDLQQFVGMLHRSGLVISNAPGQGKALRERGAVKKRKEVIGKFTNLFAIRFRGIDPEKLLNGMLPWLGWLFTVPALICFLLFFLSAALLLGSQYETVYARLPSFQQFFAADRWLYLAATMAMVKVVHEFGHGLSCKKFGGECHEIGFMLLVFTPCLYCNVSDSWMLPNKWQRVWIGAAGIYVELILASFAAYIWYFSEPGLLNDLCLNMMFLNLVSTILVNGNPLLRFDGYYILMDALEIPNLRQKATEILKRWFQQVCLGLELPDDPFLPRRHRGLFAIYTIASVIYRWVVVFSICWFLIKVLEPYGLESIGRMVAVAGFAGMIIQPVMQTYKFIRTPGRLAKVKRGRLLASLAVAGVAIAGVVYIPLPHRVRCPFEIRPTRAGAVYAGTPGQIVRTVKAGTVVREGDELAVLKNPDLEIRLADLRGRQREAEAKLRNLSLRSREDDALKAQFETQQELIQSLDKLQRKTQEEIERLVVVAKRPGIVLPPPDKPDEKGGDGRLPGWTGSPLDARNRGALLTAEDLICELGAENELEAVLIVDQGDVQLVDIGQHVVMKLESYRIGRFTGEIAEKSQTEIRNTSASLAIQAGGDLQTEIDPNTGQPKPRSVSYQARVPLTDVDTTLRPGYRGMAKIHTAPMSLGQRLWRFIAKTFNFEL